MGLDMYAWTVPAIGMTPDTDEQTEDRTSLYYWRKHPDLHGWMEALYRTKGGTAAEFNCVSVRLEAPDLDRLEKAVREHTLPRTSGFFFGQSQPEDDPDTLDFIRKAREAIEARGLLFELVVIPVPWPVYGQSYWCHRTYDGDWQVTESVYFIDRHGRGDERSYDVGEPVATEGEARAIVARLEAEKKPCAGVRS